VSRLGKEEVKWSLFADENIENPKELTEKLW
jgi:hypothetical protein